jgi:hypothetical protein
MSVQVAVRVRPFSQKEVEQGQPLCVHMVQEKT